MDKRLNYFQPKCALELNYHLYGLLCTSPEEGGLEGVEYEDLVL
jgi:hypothetical protein